jgi:hypothetical protein
LKRLFLTLCAAVLTGCVGPSRTPPLANSHPTAESLASAVLDAVARRDAATLRALALNEEEFRDHVWPELPAARPERNLPFSFVWGDLRQKSEAALNDTLAREGGRQATLVAVRFDGEVTKYPGYTVRRETALTVRDAVGATRSVRLFGSSLEKDGEWKVFSYVVDD